MPPATLETIDTPSLVLERDRLQKNLDRFSTLIPSRGVRLRIHLKTAKSAEIARLAAPDPETPIAVSTLLEAEYFWAQGYRDIFYTVGLGPGKIARAAKLLRAGVRLITTIDDASTASLLTRAAAAEKVQFRTVIEIDSGEHRAGMVPDSTDLVSAAKALGQNFAGVMTHAGQSYDARSPAEMNAVARAEVSAVLLAVERLAKAGIHSEIVSVGSSPTAIAQCDLKGITEMRAGVYVFGDLYQAGIGTCSIDDIALSVLTEVISRQPGRNSFIIDAGALALSKDTATASLAKKLNAGFGLVCDLDGHLIPGLKVERVWQEHGLVVSQSALNAQMYPIGTRLRILPNHACPTAAAHSQYHVVDHSSRVILAEWPRINGW